MKKSDLVAVGEIEAKDRIVLVLIEEGFTVRKVAGDDCYEIVVPFNHISITFEIPVDRYTYLHQRSLYARFYPQTNCKEQWKRMLDISEYVLRVAGVLKAEQKDDDCADCHYGYACDESCPKCVPHRNTY